MSDTGKQSPFGVNVVNGLLAVEGLQINPIFAGFVGESKNFEYYRFGSIVNDTVLRVITWAIQQGYYGNPDGIPAVNTYNNLISIGGRINTINITKITPGVVPFTEEYYFDVQYNSSITLTSGSFVKIDGVSPAGYNGNWLISSASAGTFRILSTAYYGQGSGGTFSVDDQVPGLGNAKALTYTWEQRIGPYGIGGIYLGDKKGWGGSTYKNNLDTTDSNPATQWAYIRLLALQAWMEFNYNSTLNTGTIDNPSGYRDFLQSWQNSYGFVEYSNDAILPNDNSKDFLEGTFSNLNDLITGDITNVSLATKNWGQDLITLGKALDLSLIDTYGLPSSLLKTLAKNNALTKNLSLAIVAAGISTDQLGEILGNITKPTVDQERKLYAAFYLTVGDALTEVLVPLNCKVQGLESVADLLSPKKLFPSIGADGKPVYQSLTVPIYNDGNTPTTSTTSRYSYGSTNTTSQSFTYIGTGTPSNFSVFGFSDGLNFKILYTPSYVRSQNPTLGTTTPNTPTNTNTDSSYISIYQSGNAINTNSGIGFKTQFNPTRLAAESATLSVVQYNYPPASRPDGLINFNVRFPQKFKFYVPAGTTFFSFSYKCPQPAQIALRCKMDSPPIEVGPIDSGTYTSLTQNPITLEEEFNSLLQGLTVTSVHRVPGGVGSVGGIYRGPALSEGRWVYVYTIETENPQYVDNVNYQNYVNTTTYTTWYNDAVSNNRFGSDGDPLPPALELSSTPTNQVAAFAANRNVNYSTTKTTRIVIPPSLSKFEFEVYSITTDGITVPAMYVRFGQPTPATVSTHPAGYFNVTTNSAITGTTDAIQAQLVEAFFRGDLLCLTASTASQTTLDFFNFTPIPQPTNNYGFLYMTLKLPNVQTGGGPSVTTQYYVNIDTYQLWYSSVTWDSYGVISETSNRTVDATTNTNTPGQTGSTTTNLSNSKISYFIYVGTSVNPQLTNPALLDKIGPRVAPGTPPVLDNTTIGSNITIQAPVKGFGSYLSTIVPPDIATAAGAFAASMSQIKNIRQVPIEKFAQVVTNLETMNATRPTDPPFTLNPNQGSSNTVPTNLNLRKKSLPQIALGSGPQGSYTMSDFFGCMSGLPYNGPLTKILLRLQELGTTKLANIYHETYLAVTWERAKGAISQTVYNVLVQSYIPPTYDEDPLSPTYGDLLDPGQPRIDDWYYKVQFGLIVPGGGYGRGLAPPPTVTLTPNNCGGSMTLSVGYNNRQIPNIFGRCAEASKNFGTPYLYATTSVNQYGPPPAPEPPEEFIEIQAPPIGMIPVQSNGSFGSGSNTSPGYKVGSKGTISQGVWYWPKGGSSPGMNSPILGYISQSNIEIDRIKTEKPILSQILNDNWNATGVQLTIEQRARQMGLRPPLADPPDSRENYLSLWPTVQYTFTDSVPSYGKNTEPHMYAQTIENIANYDTTSGISLVAMMRQERNQDRLTQIGIELDNNIPSQLPYEEQKVLIANGTLPTGVFNANIPSGSVIGDPPGPGTPGTPTYPPNPNINNPGVPGPNPTGPGINVPGTPGTPTPVLPPITTPPANPIVIIDDNPVEPTPIGYIDDNGNYVVTNPNYPSNPDDNTLDNGGSNVPGSFAGSPYTNLIPPNLNSWYTSSTLIPSTYSVTQAIEEVIRCNCDCWDLA